MLKHIFLVNRDEKVCPMKKFRRTKLPKFRLGAENFVHRKILSAEILFDKVYETGGPVKRATEKIL